MDTELYPFNQKTEILSCTHNASNTIPAYSYLEISEGAAQATPSHILSYNSELSQELVPVLVLTVPIIYPFLQNFQKSKYKETPKAQGFEGFL